MSLDNTTGYEQLRPADAALVDAICDRFERAWKGVNAEGEPPGIQPYLAGQPESVQSVLARELIALDRAYRERRGDTLTAERYLNLLSERKGVVSNASSADNWPEFSGLQIVKVLGAGGMGVVYKAWQPALDRYVAVKMLRHAGLVDAEHRERFAREARAVAQLQHPNMVPIFAIGELPGAEGVAPLPYFVMEYVAGGNLAEVLRGQPQHPRAAVQLLETLARALHYAHQQGIVHRDLKPGNILVQKAGGVEKSEESPDSPPLQFASIQPKITDFGLAKLGIGSDLTQTGDTLGTPSYMAPEQTEGKSTEISPLTDVYGLGAIFYEILTGRPPFQADTALATVLQVRNDEPVSPRRLQPTVPLELETICLKCLQKSPQQRYSSAEALADDLRRFLEGRPILARPVSIGQRTWKWVRRHPAAAGLVVVSSLATALLLAILLISDVQIRQRQRETKAALDTERQTLYFHRIRLSQAALQGNNPRQAESYLDACRPVENQRDLRGWEWHYLQRLCHTELISLEGHRVRQVAFQEGGRVAALDADGMLMVWDFTTGQVVGSKVIFPATKNVRAAFSPDGKTLAVGDESEGTLKVFAAADGRELHAFRGCRPVFSGDGRRLASIDMPPKWAWIYDLTTGTEVRACALTGNLNSAYAFHADSLWEAAVHLDRSIRVWNVETSEKRFTVPGQVTGDFVPYFSPDGQCLASAGVDGTIKIWDAAGGQERTTINAHVGDILCLAFSADNRRLASADLSGSVKVWDLQGREIRALPGHGVAVNTLDFSPEGGLLASAGADQTVKIWDTGKDFQAVVFREHPSFVSSAGFSPDGRRIVSAGSDGTLKIWDAATGKVSFDLRGSLGFIRHAAFTKDGGRIMACNGAAAAKAWDSTTAQELSSLKGNNQARYLTAAISPGGASIALPDESNQVILRDLATGEIVHQLPGHTGRIRMVAFSPDERLLASASEDKTVKVWDRATGREVCMFRGHTGGVICVAFSEDSRWVVSGGSDMLIRLWDAQTGEELRTFHNPWGRVVHSVALSPDGRRLASGGLHAIVSLWDTESGQEVLEIPTGHTIVTGVMFSPEGRRLAAVCNDGTVLVWDGPT